MNNGRARKSSKRLPSHHGLVAALTTILIVSTLATAAASVIDDAKESIRHRLFIPGSAKFSNLHQHGDYICGKVAAKTLAGTYDVPKVMIYNTKTQLSTIVDGSGISMEITDSMKTDLDHACS